MPGHYPDKIRSLPLYDGRFDAYKLEAAGADVLFASYPAGTSIPGHRHGTDNYGVIIRGELILHAEGETRRYGVGDWYHVAAGVEHAAEFEQETDEIEFWFDVGAADGTLAARPQTIDMGSTNGFIGSLTYRFQCLYRF